jgi:hypothetical protein
MEYREFLHIENRFNDNEGFVETYRDNKKGLRMLMKKEDGQKVITLRLEVEAVKIPLFNLLALIYEIDLYPLWFPFCKASKEISLISKARKLTSLDFQFPFPFSNRYS